MRLAQPWLLLVSPAATWRALEGGPWPAFAAQALLLLLGWMVSRRPMAELSKTAGMGQGGGLGSFVLLLLVILIAYCLIAVLLALFLRALGSTAGFVRILTWLAYGATPLVIGRCIGLLSFAIVQPLAKQPAEAIALQVNPLGWLSLAGLFRPLSLSWTFASALDLFAIWALVLLTTGALHYLKLGVARASALVSGLLIIWLLALTAVWQGLQRSL